MFPKFQRLYHLVAIKLCLSCISYSEYPVFQVETGVAKMNTLTVVTAAEPQVVTAVTNNTGTRASAMAGNQVMVATAGYSAGVPTLVTNSITGGGRTNPAGPQLDEDEKTGGGIIVGDDNRMNLLNSSPDEHEPLLRREQLPAESDPPPNLHHHQTRAENILTGRGSNSNNNNNRIPLGSDIKTQGAEIKPERIIDPEGNQCWASNRPKPEPPQHVGEYTTVSPFVNQDNTLKLSNPTRQVPSCRNQDPESVSCSEKSSEVHVLGVTGIPASQPRDQINTSSSSKAPFLETSALDTEKQTQKAPASVPGAQFLNPNVSPLRGQALNSPAPGILLQESKISTHADAEALKGLQPSVLMRNHMGPAKAKRPERPCSLDLSATSISSGKL